MSTDPLEVDTLPSDPREMALRLLGMTVSELKQIDERVISGQQFVGGLKTDVNKIVRDVTTSLTPTKIVTTPQLAQQPATELIPVHQHPPENTITPPQIDNNTDDDQLEFNFYKKIKPEDLEYQLKKNTVAIEELGVKIDAIYNHLLKKSTRKINGNYSQ